MTVCVCNKMCYCFFFNTREDQNKIVDYDIHLQQLFIFIFYDVCCQHISFTDSIITSFPLQVILRSIIIMLVLEYKRSIV